MTIPKFDLQRIVLATYCFVRKRDKLNHDDAIKDCVYKVSYFGLILIIALIILGFSFYANVIKDGIHIKPNVIGLVIAFLILGFLALEILKRSIRNKINLTGFDKFYENEADEVIRKERRYYTIWSTIIICSFILLITISTLLQLF